MHYDLDKVVLKKALLQSGTKIHNQQVSKLSEECLEVGLLLNVPSKGQIYKTKQLQKQEARDRLDANSEKDIICKQIKYYNDYVNNKKNLSYSQHRILCLAFNTFRIEYFPFRILIVLPQVLEYVSYIN